MLTHECLQPERLHEYSLGLLSEEESSEIELHLAECETCSETLAACDTAADSVVERIRRPGLEESASDDPWFQDAARRIKGLDFEPKSHSRLRSGTELDLPAQIRDYELRERIGEGGMGVVYRAVHTRLGKDVAVKLLHSGRVRNPEAVLRFQREMQAVGQLDHPAIVRATDAGEIDGTHFLVMEYVPGVDLGTLVRNLGPLSCADACDLIRRAALGLAHVHECSIVHRDVKPSNLLLAENGEVKILDLGLARLEPLSDSSSELTGLGQLMGTLEYMAPEQCDDSRGVDVRTDIYALGATLYKLLTVKHPFQNGDRQGPVAQLSAIANQPFPSLRECRPDLPPELDEVLVRMTARDPDDRYASAAEVAAALAPFAEGADLSTLCATAEATRSVTRPQTKSPTPAPTCERRRFVKWLLGLAALAVAAAVIVIQTDRGEIVIKSDRADLKVIVKRNDKLYDEWEISRGAKEWKVRSGSYEIILPAGNEDLRVTNGKFTLSRDGKERVSIERRPSDEIAPEAARDLTFEEKTWSEWARVIQRERSLEHVATAMNAISILGKETHRIESTKIVLDVMSKLSVWDRRFPQENQLLAATCTAAVRRLLAEETAVLFTDALEKGSSVQRYFLLECLADQTQRFTIPLSAAIGTVQGEFRFFHVGDLEAHAKNLKRQLEALTPGLQAALQDSNARTVASALDLLGRYVPNAPLTRDMAETLLDEKRAAMLPCLKPDTPDGRSRESLLQSLLRSSFTAEEKPDWQLRGLLAFVTDLAPRASGVYEKKIDRYVHSNDLGFLNQLAEWKAKAAPALPGLIKILESKESWVDKPIAAFGGFGSQSSIPNTVRVAAVRVLGKIGPAAAPALPEIRKLKSSPHENVQKAAKEAEAAILAKLPGGKAPAAPPKKTPAKKPEVNTDKTGFFYKAKTWEEWKWVIEHEKSQEALTEAVKAIATLGQQEHTRESAELVIPLIERYTSAPGTRESDLSRALGQAVSKLLSSETAPLFAEVVAEGRSGARNLVLSKVNTLQRGSQSENITKLHAQFVPGAIKALEDPNWYVVDDAAHVVGTHRPDAPEYKAFLDKLLETDPEKQHPAIRQMLERVPREAVGYALRFHFILRQLELVEAAGVQEEWQLRAVLALVDDIAKHLDQFDQYRRGEDRVAVIERLPEYGAKAVPAVPSLVRILENWKKIRGDLKYLAVPATLRALAAIGPAAKPAIPAIEAVEQYNWPSPKPDPETEEVAGWRRPQVNISELAAKTRRTILGKTASDHEDPPQPNNSRPAPPPQPER